MAFPPLLVIPFGSLDLLIFPLISSCHITVTNQCFQYRCKSMANSHYKNLHDPSNTATEPNVILEK